MPAIIPFIPLIASGLSFAGGMLANKGKQSQTTTPSYDPQSQLLRDKVFNLVSQRLNNGPADLSGYAASGATDINHSYDLAGQTLENQLTARGLNASPVAGAGAARLQASRAGDLGRFKNALPLLGRELQTQDLNLAGNVFNTGRGATSTGTFEGGGGAAGGFTNLAAMLGYLQGKGLFGQPGAPLAARQTAPTAGFLTPGGPYG